MDRSNSAFCQTGNHMITLNGMTQAQILALIEAGSVTLIEALDFVEARVIKREAGFTKDGAPRKGTPKALSFLRANGRRRPNDTTAVKVEVVAAPVAEVVAPVANDTGMDELLEQLTSLDPTMQDELAVAWLTLIQARVPVKAKRKAKAKK